jgi:hypothetical protein
VCVLTQYVVDADFVCVKWLCEEGGCMLKSSRVRCMRTGGYTPRNHMTQEGASSVKGVLPLSMKP